ncbi:S24 family peptidase, partial [Paraburkholderia fungorum]|uniref:S24 family peptidase n=1 Tax=Paraburkholderia fungorum TaxID=134537 RepID=UPI0038BCB424
MDIDAYRRSRLQELVDRDAGGNAAQFARLHNEVVTATRLRQLLNPNYRGGEGFKEGAARKLEKALKLQALYFDLGIESAIVDEHKTGRGNPSISGPKAALIKETLNEGERNVEEQDLPQPTEDEFAYVPQLDIAAACGNGRFQDHVVVKGGLAFKRSSLRDLGVPEHAARIIHASGGSMSPKIQDGRVVLINTADTHPADGKIYLICMPDGGLVLKRLVHDYHPAAGALVWIIRSDNPDKTVFPDKLLPPDDRT